MAEQKSESRKSGAEQHIAEADAQEHGYHGVKVDPTPNENYTVEGVISGAPTPETDDELAKERDARLVPDPARGVRV